MTIDFGINDQIIIEDLENCQSLNKISSNTEEDYDIIPSVTITGLHRQETIKDLVIKKQILRGYEPSNRILSKMETRLIRFNPNLNNSHSLDEIYAGTHSLQKDDLEYLVPQTKTHDHDKLEISNSTLTNVANFLYPIKKFNDALVISSSPCCIDEEKSSNKGKFTPISDYSIDTSLKLEIENTINNQDIVSKSSGVVRDDKTGQNNDDIAITPEGIVYSNEILLSTKLRTLKKIMDENNNNVQLFVPKYYADVSRYKHQNESNVTASVSIKNVNDIYTYTHNTACHSPVQASHESLNERVHWLRYAWTVFIQFWIDFWNDLKNLF
ncbi:hypothetical protein ACO0R3_002312 [Hanseniaspora guilliermondii]